MNRITKKEPNGTWNVLGIPWSEVDNRIYGALCKLKDYEDTGLSPKEVEELNTLDGSQAVRATAKLQAEQRRHRWIPVAEELPKAPQSVLLSCKCANGNTHVERAYWDNEFWQGGNTSEVIAWMPLPEPYSQQIKI